MTTLVLADHDGSSLSDQTAKVVTAAVSIGGDVHVLVAGQDIARVAAQAAELSGVSRVLLAEAPALSNNLAEPLSELIVSLGADYQVFIAAATSVGKSVMPRVAALFDVAQISEIVDVVAPDTFKRPIYAGNAIQTVQTTDTKVVLTVRTASFSPVSLGEPAAVDRVSTAAFSSDLSSFVSDALSASDRPELTSAKVVVSGGRALASAENFTSVILPVADKLSAAVGASRAAVDSGYAPNEWQVGQTGKVVAPDLYIACGISGAIQHLAGMKDSKVIVAINNDEEAPIFQIADYGLVGDLFEILPELEKSL